MLKTFPPRALYHQLKAVLALWRAGPEPILVYQMGKVGSTSVSDALAAAGLHPLQVHVLGRKAAPSRQRFAAEGRALPYRKHLERRVAASLKKSGKRVKIITLVRDPIARAISGSFQTAWRHDRDSGDAAAMRKLLTQKLMQPKALSYCYTWFQEEIEDVFAINIMDAPFDPDLGCQRLTNERADILILKLEALDRHWHTIGAFVGREVTAARSNVRAKSQDAASYRRVQEKITLPRERVIALYDHPWMRHFYSDKEIADFVAAWSGTEEDATTRDSSST